MTDAIVLDGVTRRYGSVTALDDVSFAVPENSILGLLGSNGAGKTTIMSIIAGQDRPGSGRIRVHGQSPFENSRTLAQVSFVRDNQRYPDDYKLHHVLRIAPEFAPGWDTDLAASLVDAFRIPAKTPIKKMSRGQLSAVAIVLGLASRAPVTLLDEPYLGLDVGARARFHEALIADYEKVPRTVVLSTHLIEESASLFDRVVIVDRGTVALDVDSDTAQGFAWVVSGTTEAVDEVISGSRVLHRTTVGALASVTIAGPLGDETTALARRRGLQLAPASLQDLVGAFAEATATADQEVEHS